MVACYDKISRSLRTLHVGSQRARSQRRSAFSDNVDDGFGESLRRFLGQIVPDAALDRSMRIFAQEHLCVGTRLRVWCTIGITFKSNGGHGDDRRCGKPLVQIAISRLALREPEPPAVIMDHDR